MKKYIFLALLLGGFSAHAQISVTPLQSPRQTFACSGSPCSGGFLYTYAAGTSNTLATYSDSAATVVNADPIVLDSNGSAVIYLKQGFSYKLVLQNASGVQQWAQDNVTALNLLVTNPAGNALQAISGPLNLGSFGITAGSGTFTGTSLLCKLANVRFVDSGNTCAWAGSDVGGWLNSAYADLPSAGGEIWLACRTDGTPYSFSTPIVFGTSGKYPNLRVLGPSNSGASGCALNYSPTTATVALRLDYTPTSGGGYAAAKLEGLTLLNNGCVTNGGCGGLATGLKTGGTNGGAHKLLLENVTIRGFSKDLDIADVGGGPGWGITGINVSLSSGLIGWNYSVNHENDTCVGCVFAVNGTNINMVNQSELTLTGGSVDSALTCGVAMAGASLLHATDVHWENEGISNVHYVCGGAASELDLKGGFASDDVSVGSTDFWFQASIISVSWTQVFSPGRTVTNLFSPSDFAAVYVVNNSPSVLTGNLGVQFPGANNIFCEVGPGISPVCLYKTLQFEGSGSGTTTVQAPATATGTITLPAQAGTLQSTLSASDAAVDLASVATGACTTERSVTVTGAAFGNAVQVKALTALEAGTFLTGKVTASNTVKWQFCNLSGGAVDRASDTYTITVLQ